MRRKLVTLGLVTAMVLMAALPATAAPNNKNNEFNVIEISCDDPVGDIAVRPNPGRGLPAWDVETGQHQVAKRFTFSDTVTITIIEGPGSGDGVSNTFAGVEDYGAEKGNKDLVECTADDAFSFPLEVDEEIAAGINADFGTDIFEAGQVVWIEIESTLTVLAMITGK